MDHVEAHVVGHHGRLGLATDPSQCGVVAVVSRLLIEGDVAVLQGVDTANRRVGVPAAVGIDGQTVALSSNTMLPSVKAKISMRIAPGDEPQRALDALRAHLTSNLPWGARLKFGDIELGKPYAAQTNTWSHRLASQALSAAWNHESVNIGIGGSIPFIADLVELFPKAQILVTGVEDPDSRAHSPNESLHIETLRRAILAESLVLLEANDILNS